MWASPDRGAARPSRAGKTEADYFPTTGLGSPTPPHGVIALLVYQAIVGLWTGLCAPEASVGGRTFDRGARRPDFDGNGDRTSGALHPWSRRKRPCRTSSARGFGAGGTDRVSPDPRSKRCAPGAAAWDTGSPPPFVGGDRAKEMPVRLADMVPVIEGWLRVAEAGGDADPVRDATRKLHHQRPLYHWRNCSMAVFPGMRLAARPFGTTVVDREYWPCPARPPYFAEIDHERCSSVPTPSKAAEWRAARTDSGGAETFPQNAEMGHSVSATGGGRGLPRLAFARHARGEFGRWFSCASSDRPDYGDHPMPRGGMSCSGDRWAEAHAASRNG